MLEEYGLRPIPLEPPSEEDIKVLAAIVGSSSSEQAASNLGISERELGVRIGMLKEAGIEQIWKRGASDRALNNFL